jgi:hypothetical protein
VRLHIGVLGAEQILDAINRELFDNVYEFANTIVAPTAVPHWSHRKSAAASRDPTERAARETREPRHFLQRGTIQQSAAADDGEFEG